MHWGDSVFEVRGGLRAISVGLCLLRRLIGPLRIREGQLNLFGDLPGFCLRALVLSMLYLQSIFGEVSCSLISFPALFRLCARSWTV